MKIFWKFAAITHNQCHKQQNAIVKGDGGVIWITENEEVLDGGWLLVQKLLRVEGSPNLQINWKSF